MAYVGYSKSVNAVQAEANGLYPASVIARKIGGGATAAGVRAIMEPQEWHHTSCRYNRTDYYSLFDAQESAELIRRASGSKTAVVTVTGRPELIVGAAVRIVSNGVEVRRGTITGLNPQSVVIDCEDGFCGACYDAQFVELI